jgi:DNA-binding IclR family transcriptional regulator
MMRTAKQRGVSIQSVDRAIDVLEYLSSSGWSGVTEIARALGTHKSTAYRLLVTLKDRGLVEQDSNTDRYRLGLGLVNLAAAVTGELDIVQYARPVCERLRDETGGTITISVLTGNDVMVIYQTMSSSSVLSVDWRGKHLPLHCTSDGKVLLAYLPESRQRTLLQGSLQRFTPHTIVDPVVLKAQLHTIREVGYGYTVEELEIGLNAVAVPIFTRGASVLATLGLSGPAFRFPSPAISGFAERAISSAAEISNALGGISRNGGGRGLRSLDNGDRHEPL